jgi:Leucine-rich repeat (LRR) protein
MAENASPLFLDAGLTNMPDLSWSRSTELHMENNDIRVIFSEYLPLGIQILEAGGNRIHNDGIPFDWPESLESIALDYNSITDAEGIRWPAGLKKLYLHSNPLKTWPPALPDGLQVLSLNKTDICDVMPLPLGLKQFFIRGARVRQLPPCLPDSLEVVIAANNFLRSSRLPSYWGNSLKQVNLSKNSLISFPKGLPDSVQVLCLDGNKITEIPAGLPENLRMLFLRKNKLRVITIEARANPLHLVAVDDNELTVSVRDYQKNTKVQWARSVTEGGNWNQEIHHAAQKTIRQKWRVYRLQKRLRTLKKTAIVREELQQVSMHPSRAGRFENISSDWGWGC